MDAYHDDCDVAKFSSAPVYRYVPPQLGNLYADLGAWNRWSWGVWDGRSASWGVNSFFGDDPFTHRRFSSWWADDSEEFHRWRPWDSACWKVSEVITTTTYELPPQFVQAVQPIGGTIILGYVPEDDRTAATLADSAVGITLDDGTLPASVNTAFDVMPLFTQAVNGTNRGDYSAAIYAMRRAASVNPLGVFGENSRVMRVVAGDAQWAEEVRRARSVFENPPARVVSEADAAFMVASLCAALGETQCARQSLSTALQVGDQHSSTALSRRALDGDDFRSAGPWTRGRKLR